MTLRQEPCPKQVLDAAQAEQLPSRRRVAASDSCVARGRVPGDASAPPLWGLPTLLWLLGAEVAGAGEPVGYPGSETAAAPLPVVAAVGVWVGLGLVSGAGEGLGLGDGTGCGVGAGVGATGSTEGEGATGAGEGLTGADVATAYGARYACQAASIVADWSAVNWFMQLSGV